MEVKTLPVGQLQTNCYLAIDQDTNKAIVIDPGDDGEFIIQKILDERVELEAIVATHGHFDHVLAVNELKLAFNVPFVMHSRDEFLLERMRETTKHFVGFDPGPAPKVDDYLDEAEIFGFGNIKLRLFHSPGHTPGSVSLYDDKSKKLFVGDVLFADGAVGRTDFSYCSVRDLKNSIRTIFTLPDQALAFPGHDREFYLADEKLYYGHERE